MNEEVEKLKENALLHISTWWGLKYPGYSGTIITADKELYEYFFYNDLVPAEFKGQKVNYVDNHYLIPLLELIKSIV